MKEAKDMNEKDLFLREIEECIELLKIVREIAKEHSSWGLGRCGRVITRLILTKEKILGAIKLAREVRKG